MKKKLITIIMAATMAVSLCACGKDDATEQKTSAEQTKDMNTTESNLETTTENSSDNNVSKSDYELLEQFISLVCSYSDPPALEGDAYQQYFKEEYDKWRNGNQGNSHWSFHGQYDEIAGGIHYYGSRVDEVYTDDGEKIENCLYTEGEGVIRRSDDGIIYWYDYVEQKGEDCTFERAE